jgi:hypothetical protein
MPEPDNQPVATSATTEYTIVVEGALDPSWSEWFGGMVFRRGPDDTTIISAQMVDQAALHRVIRKIRDLGLVLISLQRGQSTHTRSSQ